MKLYSSLDGSQMQSVMDGLNIVFTAVVTHSPRISAGDGEWVWKTKKSTRSFIKYVTISTIAGSEVWITRVGCCLY